LTFSTSHLKNTSFGRGRGGQKFKPQEYLLYFEDHILSVAKKLMNLKLDKEIGQKTFLRWLVAFILK